MTRSTRSTRRAGLEQRDHRAAPLAADRARLRVRDSRRHHPARIPRVLQVDRTQLRVQRTDLREALRVRGEHRRRPRLERPASRLQRLIRRVDPIAAGESPPARAIPTRGRARRARPPGPPGIEQPRFPRRRRGQARGARLFSARPFTPFVLPPAAVQVRSRAKCAVKSSSPRADDRSSRSGGC